jgi:hypothetical protein
VLRNHWKQICHISVAPSLVPTFEFTTQVLTIYRMEDLDRAFLVVPVPSEALPNRRHAKPRADSYGWRAIMNARFVHVDFQHDNSPVLAIKDGAARADWLGGHWEDIGLWTGRSFFDRVERRIFFDEAGKGPS